MDLIKKFCLDKGRVGVAIVCLLMLCIGLISSNTGETYAASVNYYSCPLGGLGPVEDTTGDYYCRLESVLIESESYNVGTD